MCKTSIIVDFNTYHSNVYFVSVRPSHLFALFATVLSAVVDEMHHRSQKFVDESLSVCAIVQTTCSTMQVAKVASH